MVHRDARAGRLANRGRFSRFPPRPRPGPWQVSRPRERPGGACRRDPTGPRRARGAGGRRDPLAESAGPRVRRAAPLRAQGPRLLRASRAAARAARLRGARAARRPAARWPLAAHLFWHDVLPERRARAGAAGGAPGAAASRGRPEPRAGRGRPARAVGSRACVVPQGIFEDREAQDMTEAKTPEPGYRPISGIAESLAAIDDVIAVAQRTIRVFDIALANRGFNSPARAERLRE